MLEIRALSKQGRVLECHFGDILVLPIRALCERYIEWREVPRTSGKRRSVSAVIAVIEQHLKELPNNLRSLQFQVHNDFISRQNS